MSEPLIFELSRPGRCAARLPELDVPEADLPEGFIRDELPLPEVSARDLIGHYTRLSQLTYSIDGGFYPLGSCTMKYNPKINELAAALPGFTALHPYQPVEQLQSSSNCSGTCARSSPRSPGWPRSPCTPPPARTASSSA